MTKKIISTEIIRHGHNLYFSLWDRNAICSMSENGNDFRILYTYSDAKLNTGGLTGKVAISCNRCFFAPFKSDEIVVYDLVSDNVTSLKLNKAYFNNKKILNFSAKFWNVIGNEKTVYMFGYGYPAIIKIDAKTLETTYLFDYAEGHIESIFNSDKLNEAEGYFGNGYAEIDGKYYIASGVCSGVWEFDIKTESLSLIKLKSNAEGFFSIASYKNDLLLTSIDSGDCTLYIWEIGNKNVRSIALPVGGLWNVPIVLDGDVYLFPWTTNEHVVRINEDSGNCDVCDRFDQLLKTELGEKDSVLAVELNESEIFFILVNKGVWVTYDLKKDEQVCVLPEITDQNYLSRLQKVEYDLLFHRLMNSSEVIREEDMPLSEFLLRVLN